MKKNNSSIYNYVLLVIGLLSIVMVFLPALVHSSSESVFRGYELIIGTEFIDLGSVASGQIEPSIFIGVAYLLVMAACLLVVFSKRVIFISVALFVVAIILLFLVPEMTITSVTVLGNTTPIEVEWSMAFGLYISIGLAFIGALLSIYPMAKRSIFD